MNPYVIAAFSVYFTILLAIGLFSHKKSKSETDFILGNRSLNFWLTALSAHAADMSAWLFMSLPAAIFLGGIPGIWMGLGLLIGMYCNWQFVSRRLRDQTEETDSYTLPTFFEKRFKDRTGIIRALTASLCLFFLTSYLSAGLIAMGYTFESLFGIDFYIGITIATSVVIAYTFVGGFVAVAWTDLFQALFLLLVVLFVPLYIFFLIPEGSIRANAAAQGISLHFFGDYSFNTFTGIIYVAFGWGLGYFGQPHIVTKFMGIDKGSETVKAKYVGMTWQFLAMGGAIIIGLIGIGFFGTSLENPELVFVEMVKMVFHPFIGGFILCAVLAANISTMDSQILVSASTLTEDVYKKFFAPKSSSAHLLKISRLSVVLVGVVAYLFATSKSATVTSAVLYAWAGLGSSFGPLVLVSLYSKKVNAWGAIAGILVGGIMSATWHLSGSAMPAMIPAFSCSLLSIFSVSAITSNKKFACFCDKF